MSTSAGIFASCKEGASGGVEITLFLCLPAQITVSKLLLGHQAVLDPQNVHNGQVDRFLLLDLIPLGCRETEVRTIPHIQDTVCILLKYWEYRIELYVALRMLTFTAQPFDADWSTDNEGGVPCKQHLLPWQSIVTERSQCPALFLDVGSGLNI